MGASLGSPDPAHHRISSRRLSGFLRTAAVSQGGASLVSSAPCSWTAHTQSSFLRLCTQVALRGLKRRIKTRHLKQLLCLPLGSRMTLLFPTHSNVCLWTMSPFSDSSLSGNRSLQVQEKFNSARAFSLYVHLRLPDGTGWPQ